MRGARPAGRALLAGALLFGAGAVAQDAARGAAEPPVATAVVTGTVTVEPLGAPGTGSAGVLPPAVSGLPRDLWSRLDADDLARRIAALPPGGPRAATLLERSAMLAEAAPPGTGNPGALLAARLARLVERGHLDAAAALADRTGARTPALRRAAFDVALLIGDEGRACRNVDPDPSEAGDYARRVFCLVRGGDWSAAATVFDGARALGRLDPLDAALLAAFLDPELADGPPPDPPVRPSPLQFRLLEALGAPIPTHALPIAYARSDLREVAGRKARLEAAERLARAGALEGARLLELYAARRASASGGVWERVRAVRALDAALAAGNGAAVTAALPEAVAALDAAGLLPAMADALYPAVEALEGEVGADGQGPALVLGLLSARYEDAAARWPEAEGPHLSAARAVARGERPPPGGDALDEAVGAAFAPDAAVPERLAVPAAEGRFGEALLLALGDLARGAAGDRARLAGALAFLRANGLEGPARRAALELLVGRGAA